MLPKKPGHPPSEAFLFAKNFGISKRAIYRLGGVERIKAMSPDARRFMIGLVKKVDNAITNGDI